MTHSPCLNMFAFMSLCQGQLISFVPVFRILDKLINKKGRGTADWRFYSNRFSALPDRAVWWQELKNSFLFCPCFGGKLAQPVLSTFYVPTSGPHADLLSKVLLLWTLLLEIFPPFFCLWSPIVWKGGFFPFHSTLFSVLDDNSFVTLFVSGFYIFFC